MRFFLGKSTPAMRAKVYPPLALPLFMAFIFADNPHHTSAADNFALGTHFFH
jgi:hypothetical protein